MEYSLPMDSVYLRLFDASVKLEMSLWSSAEEAVSKAYGIKLGSVGVLRATAEHHDAARVQDLAETLGITIGAVSKHVDRLEAAGLVMRTPHETDGRSHVIGRTSRGISVLEVALAAMDKALHARLSEHHPESSLRALATRLEKLAAV